MQTVRNTAAASVGTRLLVEIEETNLDEVCGSINGCFVCCSWINHECQKY